MKTGGGREIKQGSLQEVAMRARENGRSYGVEVLQDTLRQQRLQMMEERTKWKMEQLMKQKSMEMENSDQEAEAI